MPLCALALATLLAGPLSASELAPDALLTQLEASHTRPLLMERSAGELRVSGFVAGPWAGSPERVAQDFLRAHAALIGPGWDSAEPAAVLPVREDTIVRLQRRIDGVPVQGVDASVLVRADGRVSMLRVSQQRVPSVDTSPVVLGDRALAIAVDAAGLPGPLDGEPQPRLVVLPRGGHAALVWQVALSSTTPVRSVLVSVDAHSGAVLAVSDRRREARGLAWDQSPLDGATIEVELQDLSGDQDGMTGADVHVESIVFDGGSQTSTQLALPDEGGDFLYEPDEDAADDPFAEVHTYFHLSTLRRYFTDTLGHEFDSQLQAFVNYREDEGSTYDNAYFSQDMFGNDMLVFGQGSLGDFSYDTDIIAHEHGHAIIEARTAFPSDFIVYDDYGWNNAIGGIHEGVADFWAGSYQGDSMVGEYIPVRDMDNDTVCPEDLTGESHDDGEIVGAATWDMAQVVGMDEAEIIVYTALGMLSDSPTYAELAQLCIDVAWERSEAGGLDADLVGEVEALMQERGMLRCGRALELDLEQPVDVQVNLIMGLTELPGSACDMAREGGFAFTMPFQLAFTTPPASEGAVESVTMGFTLRRLDFGDIDDDTLEYSFLVREGDLVTFDMESVNTGMGFYLDVPYALDYDVEFAGSPRSITFDSESMELANDTTYYLAMRHMNCAAVDMTISTELVLDAPTDDSGLDDTGDDEPGGCGCGQVAGVDALPAGGAALLGLLALGVVRRREPRDG